MCARWAASAAAAPSVATTVWPSRSDAWSAPTLAAKFSTADCARERDQVDLPIEQLAIDVDVVVGVADHLGAVRAQQVGEVVRLVLGVHHQRAAAEQRARIEPAQVIAEVHHLADDQQRRLGDRLFLQLFGELLQRAGDGALRRQRALHDDRRRFVRRSAVLDQRLQHLRQLLRARVTGDRAVELRQAVPVAPCAFSRPSSSWPRTNVTVSPPP